MFAYCNNNPVSFIDYEGERIESAVSLLDYYIIHKLVQIAVVATYGYAMEVYVKDLDGARGFLDLYDASLNQYYEVKHADYSPGATEVQMSRYDRSTIHSWMFKDYTINNPPMRGTNMAISGSFGFKDYLVEYFFVAPGLIHYTVSLVPQKQHSTVTVPLPQKKEKNAFALAGCFFLCGGGAPIRGNFNQDFSCELASVY